MSSNKLRNLGPKSMERLRVIGIRTREDLEEVGAVEVYRRILDAGLPANRNLLWALQGAILDMSWIDVPSEMKEKLLEELESE